MTRFLVFVNNKDCLILVKTFALLYGIIKASIQKRQKRICIFTLTLTLTLALALVLASPADRVATVLNMANLQRTEDPRLARPPRLCLPLGRRNFDVWFVKVLKLARPE